MPLLIGVGLSAVFLLFGGLMMFTAFYQDHPVVFLALFFSSSLIILLSAAMIVGLILRSRYRPEPSAGSDSGDPPEGDSLAGPEGTVGSDPGASDARP